MQTTTIQVSKQVKGKLDRLKVNPRETYENVIEMLLSLVPTGDEEGEYTDEFRVALLRARMQIQSGKTVSHEELKKKLGL